MLRKDPLIHFLVLGAILFVVLSLIDAETPPDRIVISAAEIAEMSRAASLLQGREPTRNELEQLVDSAIRDEVYYRQALADGLDVGDELVRQRLVAKMRELNENMVEPVPPETDLQAWFTANAARFRIPEQVSFEQVYFDLAERGAATEAAVADALAALGNGADPAMLGDSTPLSLRYEAAAAARIRVLFGEELTAAVFAAMPQQWLGPLESGFGLHLVRVTERTPARNPDYDEVADSVREAYAADALAAANDAAFEQMRSGYDIEIEWPASVEATP